MARTHRARRLTSFNRAACRRPRNGLLPDRRPRAGAAARPAARARHDALGLGARAHRGADQGREGCVSATALPARSVRCCSTSCSSSRRQARRSSSRSRPTPTPRSRSAPPERSATDSPTTPRGARSEILSFFTSGASSPPTGLPDTPDHHRRLPPRRARQLGANSEGCTASASSTSSSRPRSSAPCERPDSASGTGTINHPALLAGLLPLGLDAITSDTPAELRAALAASEARARAVHLPHSSTLANPWQRYGARSGGG